MLRMTWYNPFRAKKGQEEPILYCANPQCRKPIDEGPLAYEPQEKEVVHGGYCQNLLIAHRAMQRMDFVVGNFDIISLKKAQDLARSGKISKTCLEAKANQ